jgi:putative transposase
VVSINKHMDIGFAVFDLTQSSSKTCRFCGLINSELKLSDGTGDNREWTCECGAVLDRDLNAAQNLRSLAVRGDL